MNTSWIERQTATPEARRSYECERLLLTATESLSQTMQSSGLSDRDIARRIGDRAAELRLLLSGEREMTLSALADLATARGQRVIVSLQPLPELER